MGERTEHIRATTDGLTEETVIVLDTHLHARMREATAAGGRLICSAPTTLDGAPAYALTIRY